MSGKEGTSGASRLLVRQSNIGKMQGAPLLVNWQEALGSCTADNPTPTDRASGKVDDELTALIDFGQLNEIFENFLEVTGLPIAILDRNARVLASSKWQRLCTMFHRAHSDTLVGCVTSDMALSSQLSESSPCAMYRCVNGLTDCATPIIVDGVRVADLFTGQFLLEPPDMGFFKRQQERCGFDEKEYFEALSDVPIVAEQEMQAVLKLLRGLAQQIAQQSLANARLKATTQMLQTVVNTVPQYVFWKDRQSRYLGCNQAVAQLAGATSPHEVIGKTDYELPWRQSAPLYQRDDADVMETGVAKRDIIEPIDMGDGTVRWMEADKVPLVDPSGTIFGTLGIVKDVTERKEAEAALNKAKEVAERANEAKSRFLAAVSHDLRQPLAALSLYVGALEGKLSPADSMVQANMRDCVAHLSGMLSNLLDLSRLEAGVVKPNAQDFDLDEVITKVVSSLRPAAGAKGLMLRVASVSKIGRTDPTLFQRILSNLLGNAIRYTKRGGVLVGTRRRDNRMWIEVWDTGIGIPMDRTGEIFEEFKQLENSERNATKGTGLGLAIVARTAALLGLKVRLNSKIGKGSMFAVELPLGEKLQPDESHTSYEHRSLQVALVEDNEQVADALVYALTASGHDVVSAASLERLMPKLGAAAPDIVISDFRLAGEKSGFDVVRAVRSAFGRDLPALIITGDTSPEVIRRMADEGVCVQHKPIDLDALRARIAALTSRAA